MAMVQKASRASPKKRRKGTRAFLPRWVVFVAWLVALVALAGLIYWGKSTKPESPRTKSTVREHSAGKAFDHREATGSKEAAKPRRTARHEQTSSPVGHEKSVSEGQEPTNPKAPPEKDHHESGNGNHLAALGPESRSIEPPKPVPIPQQPSLTPPLARVAIIIDDFGLNLEIARKFLEVPMSLTFSVLPHQRYSQEIAELAHGRHREVILHMPMEPRGYPKVNPGKGALLLSMSDVARQQSLCSALDASPYFAGINNHMGSHFTENASMMRATLEEAQKRRLYFVDSFTSSRSVAAEVAQELQIPFRRRDIFLDNNLSETAIRAQLKQVIRRAKIQGTALAIGHPHEATLRALLKEQDEFEREKIAVVPAGELMPGS
jgi:uncharacterized protein